MKEFYFVVRVFLLTLVVVVILQVQYQGETLETKASRFFGSSQSIELIRTSAQHFIDKLKQLSQN